MYLPRELIINTPTQDFFHNLVKPKTHPIKKPILKDLPIKFWLKLTIICHLPITKKSSLATKNCWLPLTDFGKNLVNRSNKTFLSKARLIFYQTKWVSFDRNRSTLSARLNCWTRSAIFHNNNPANTRLVFTLWNKTLR